MLKKKNKPKKKKNGSKIEGVFWLDMLAHPD